MDNTKVILPSLPALPRTPEECVTWAAALQQAYYQQLLQIHTLLRGNLRWQNLRSNLSTQNIVGAAPVVFSFAHNLGKVPEAAFALLPVAGSIYATAANRAAWTTTTIQLTSSVAGPIAATILVI